jgi:replicative DNA helicase
VGIIKARFIDRELIEATRHFGELGHDRTIEPAEKLAETLHRILEISESISGSDTVHIGNGIEEVYATIDERRVRGDVRFTGTPSGIADLDELTGGFKAGSLVIIAARPSLGKTAIAGGIARHVAVEEKVPVLFVSLEQSHTELIERMLCGAAEVDSHRLQIGRLRPAESDRLFQAGELLARGGIFIDATPSQTVTQIAANARRLKRAYGVRMVIIDYLQLITTEGKKETRQEHVANISRRLKLLARELEIPVIVLAQLNRQAEVRGDQKPKLSDLRESGALEQDADVVLLLHRQDGHEGLIDLLVAKQRNGPIGEVRLLFVKQHMRFENFAVPAVLVGRGAANA